MRQHMQKLLFSVLCAITFSASQQSHAQQLNPWGGAPNWYGWGLPIGWTGWNLGFGSGGTVPGNILDGWGAYLNGLGYYNNSTAMANAIDVNSWLRLMSAVNEGQMEHNHSNYMRRLRRHESILNARQKIFERLRDNPNDFDIKNGDAINVKMRLLMKPGYSTRVANELKIPVSKEVLSQLVFSKPSEGLHISLKEWTNAPQYTNLLRQQRFADLRLRLETSWSRAIDFVQTNGFADDTLLRDVTDALIALRTRVDAEYGHIDQAAYSDARSFIKHRQEALRALNSDTLNGFIQLITSTPNLTLGQLLEAMTTRSMQFFPAADAAQAATYERFYAVIRGAPPTVLSEDTFSEVFSGTELP